MAITANFAMLTTVVFFLWYFQFFVLSSMIPSANFLFEDAKCSVLSNNLENNTFCSKPKIMQVNVLVNNDRKNRYESDANGLKGK